ncbi:uncharacterized protein LOC114162038 [Xiphophorus couchianus]|uniref:uncharacterized protein LOC114162038 n=1 Tax=Xiphophorus couchianus TaxID=32473 RepID=UPI001016D8E9|nr:uncharacterized protein LOC114162038 [Xiphophorus couchianus]
MAKQKSSVRPCPQECGFTLHEKDQHEACPVCLGIVHARRALSEPTACAFCSQLQRSTLERRVKFVQKVLGEATVSQQDPLLSESRNPVSSESDEDEGAKASTSSWAAPASSWADHMEYVDGLAETVQDAAPSHYHLEAQGDDDVLDIGLESHSLSEDDDDFSAGQCPSAAASSPVGQDDTSFLSLCRRAADKLDVEWPTPPPAQKVSRFTGFYLPREPAAVKNRLPMFPDFVSELTSSWNKPLSTRVTVPGYGQYVDLEGADKAGLVNLPPMEASLAAYLAPSYNHGVGGSATLPSKQCRFSASQLEKTYRAQATTARSLSSATMLQTYQAMCLSELGAQMPPDSHLIPLLNEIRITADYILRTSRCAALSLGRGMASTVVAQRHLWLTLSDVPDRDRAIYLDEPVSTDGLFGQSLDAIQAKFELKKKQTEALRCIIPRRDARSRSNMSARKPSAIPLPKNQDQSTVCHSVHNSQTELLLSIPAEGSTSPTVHQVSSLAARVPFWRACALSPWIERTVATGYRLQFRIRPPRFQSVINTTVGTEAARVLRDEINTLLAKGAVRVVPASEAKRGWYSRYFVVPKKGGGLRPILDLRVLNKHLRKFKFKMLTLRQLLNAVGPGDWFATIDLTDAYFHVAIHPEHRRFLRFAFEGIAYEYLVLPFGLSLAPRTFMKIVETALAPLREKGIRILAYLDDWALIASSREQAAEQLPQVLSHIQALGFSVNFQKSSLNPSQQFSFLGLEICSLSARARLSEHRVTAFHRCLAQFQLGCKLRFQTVLRLMGIMASMIAVVPLGLLKMRPIQRWTRSHRLCTSRHLHRRLTITASCMSALRPWREPGLLYRGSPIGRVSFRKVLSTDASLKGWGAICDGVAVRGVWTLSQSKLHINYLELRAVLLALRHFCKVLMNQHVLIRTDNTTVVSYINRQGGTHSLPLLKLSHRLLQWCSIHFLSVKATHIPGHLNLGADLLSRGGPLVREWRLHPSVVVQIWRRFGKASVDLFATKANTHCPLFFSITDHSAPLGVDALAHPWPNVLLYAFPPVEIILPVLERVRRWGLSLILVAPRWPAKSWYAEIISLLVMKPWKLPARRDLLSQAGGEVFHPHPELWMLHAYLLRGPAC